MLRTYIGINEDEVRNKQDVLHQPANCLSTPLTRSQCNQIEQGAEINRPQVTKAIISHVEGQQVLPLL